MKIKQTLPGILLIGVVAAFSCKSMAKAAAKHWTKKQMKEFRKKCEDGALGKFGAERSKDFCTCAGESMETKFHNYDEAKGKSFTEILTTARDCIQK